MTLSSRLGPGRVAPRGAPSGAFLASRLAAVAVQQKSASCRYPTVPAKLQQSEKEYDAGQSRRSDCRLLSCGPRPRNRWFADSPLEGRVTSELVSGKPRFLM